MTTEQDSIWSQWSTHEAQRTKTPASSRHGVTLVHYETVDFSFITYLQMESLDGKVVCRLGPRADTPSEIGVVLYKHRLSTAPSALGEPEPVGKGTGRQMRRTRR